VFVCLNVCLKIKMAPSTKSKVLNKTKIEVYGLLSSSCFHKARCCAQDLFSNFPRRFDEPTITKMHEFQWKEFVEKKKAEMQGETWGFKNDVLCFVDNEPIHSEIELFKWAKTNHNHDDYRPEDLYLAIAKEQYNQYFLDNKSNSYVNMEISIDGTSGGAFLFELNEEKLPLTCKNFKDLCSAEVGGYRNCAVHRIVADGWMQSGSIAQRKEISGPPSFSDETFCVKHDRRGVLGMCNERNHENRTQFYVTFQPAPFMDTRYVAFGQLLEGWDLLRKIEKIETNCSEQPTVDVRISRCGVKTPTPPYKVHLDEEAEIERLKVANEQIQEKIRNIEELRQAEKSGDVV